jgi:hypothetical protein
MDLGNVGDGAATRLSDGLGLEAPECSAKEATDNGRDRESRTTSPSNSVYRVAINQSLCESNVRVPGTDELRSTGQDATAVSRWKCSTIRWR